MARNDKIHFGFKSSPYEFKTYSIKVVFDDKTSYYLEKHNVKKIVLCNDSTKKLLINSLYAIELIKDLSLQLDHWEAIELIRIK